MEIMTRLRPDGWALRSLGQVFVERKEKGSDKEFPALSVTMNGIVPQLETAAKTDRGDDRKVVRIGDYVINSRSDRKGSSGLSKFEGSVSLISIVMKPTAIQPQFAHHLLRSVAFQEEFYRFGRGIVDDLWSTRFDDLKRIQVYLPSSDQQIRIATYLDRETARIDALIERKTRFIELLKEKRQALITQAVTKGLDQTVPMKDSGVEWIGEVPGHWEIVALKRAIMLQRGHDLPDAARKNGEVPVVSSGGVIGTHDRARARAPGIVTGRYGSIGQFTYVENDYWPLNTALYSVDLRGNETRFVWYLLQSISHLFLMHSTKSAVPGIDRNDIHREFAAIPMLHEQKEIADFLDAECLKLESLQSLVQRSIDLLKERRSALITAAVTGQIDLREDAA